MLGFANSDTLQPVKPSILTFIAVICVLVGCASRAPDEYDATIARMEAYSAQKPSAKAPELVSESSELAQSLLVSQKAKAAATTKAAAEIISSGQPMTRMKRLYQLRFAELGKLRDSVISNNKLHKSDKARIESALKGEQEAITRILDEYESLYGK